MKFMLLASMLLLGLSAQAQQFDQWDRGGDRGGWDRGNDRDDWGRPGPGWPGNGGGGRTESMVVQCDSVNRQVRNCPVQGRIIEAQIAYQNSNSPCIQNSTWGYNNSTLWVTGGCRASFRVTYISEGRPGPGPGPGPRPPREESVRCGSPNYRYNTCGVNGMINYIQVERQLSNSACREGRSYGWNNNSIWVDQGCEAVFRVFYYGR